MVAWAPHAAPNRGAALAAVCVRCHVAVYLPQSYNFAGQLVVVPSDRIEDVALASSEVLAFILSSEVTKVGAGVGSGGAGPE